MDMYSIVKTYVLATFERSNGQYISLHLFRMNVIPLYLMYEGMDVTLTLGYVLRDMVNDGLIAQLDLGDCLYYRKFDLN